MSALVRWLPELAVASADDIRRFGPQAARVRSLLDFIPTMSEDAGRVGTDLWHAVGYAAGDDARRAAWYRALGAASDAADDAARNAAGDAAGYDARNAADDAAWHDASWTAWHDTRHAALTAADNAARAEVVSDLISPENYRLLTNPLATGRAVDVLAPRYKDTPFREMLQELASPRVITQPSDVLAVGRIARSPEEIRDIAMTLIADGMTVEEALNAARLLA